MGWLQVGWFLHTPFPSSEIYRTLPVREEVLRATLRADLIGFHTYDYARHFISSCTRILGLEGTPEGVEDNGRWAPGPGGGSPAGGSVRGWLVLAGDKREIGSVYV